MTTPRGGGTIVGPNPDPRSGLVATISESPSAREDVVERVIAPKELVIEPVVDGIGTVCRALGAAG
ncbi:MAG: hypothetical protein WKF96_19175 [Solirubrobacteraceae bacterium]